MSVFKTKERILFGALTLAVKRTACNWCKKIVCGKIQTEGRGRMSPHVMQSLARLLRRTEALIQLDVANAWDALFPTL